VRPPVVYNLRSRDQALLELAARLRAGAAELEQLCDDPSHMPPPPAAPRSRSLHDSLRAKTVSKYQAGGWAAGIAIGIELARVVLEHLR
jgi:hypothetical protein